MDKPLEHWQDDPCVRAWLGHNWVDTLALMEDAVNARNRQIQERLEAANLTLDDQEYPIGWFKRSDVQDLLRD